MLSISIFWEIRNKKIRGMFSKFMEDIILSKDMGSAAVLLSIVMTLLLWFYVLFIVVK